MKNNQLTLTVLAVTLGLSSSLTIAADSGVNDPYIEGFKAYAEEVKSYSKVLNSAVTSYADDVFKTERSVGYIGKLIPIPKAVKVADGVYTVVGSQIWHNPSNYGLNNNLSFIIFEDGVFVFNTGANVGLSYALHQQIKAITDKPVKWVAVENNQGHAYLGASYWVDIGVKNLYSSEGANEQFDIGFPAIKAEWSERVGKDLTKSVRNVSDKFTTYTDKMEIDVGGGEKVIIQDFGPGHTPASTSLYIPSRNVFFSGDLGFNERMPVFFRYTDSFAWIESFEAMMAAIPADTKVVPGHGTPTDMQTLKVQTYDYIVYLHEAIEKIADADGNMDNAMALDQSAYKDRPVFAQASKNNAKHVYNEITGGDF
ncbi:MAG: hypothetical protein ISEC1_P1738 [Thiomicrorhabdus sp.]|nr:MAG: hypothetical protein ISEC1_P1738 [Thiomicrorhabdus sp.]